MRPVARLGDKTIGSCEVHGDDITGQIITGAANALVNGKPTARLGDTVLASCGHTAKIITGTAVSLVNGGSKPTARLGDQVGDSPYTAIIITASQDTFTAG